METQGDKDSGKSIFLSLAVLFALIVTFSYVAIYPDISTDGKYSEYAILFPPNTKNTEALNHITRAGGKPVRGTKFEFLMIAVSKNPEFKKQLKKQGALFLFNPIILGGCYIEKKAA
tara:strand:- start:190474 stop:190824 length:351 start_codon:yes stop_codon:yes gene_type:complete